MGRKNYKVDVRKSKSRVVIKTDGMTLTYSGQDKFSAENLSITFRMADPKAKKGVRTVTWTPGMDDSGNLLSTARTLDLLFVGYEGVTLHCGVALSDDDLRDVAT